MDDSDHVNFSAPAVLRKWPSLGGDRIPAAQGARPYLIVDGTLRECIDDFMAKPISTHHLYEIHTAPQGEIVPGVMSANLIVEIARLREFL